MLKLKIEQEIAISGFIKKSDKDKKGDKYYCLRLPADIYNKLREYVADNKSEGTTIRKFINDAIVEKLERE